MATAVEEYKRLQAQLKKHEQWWEETLLQQQDAQRVISPLYHYTDANGLMGIIKNQEIWFTSMFHLNDPSELNYGLQIAWETIDKIARARKIIPQMMARQIKTVLPDITREHFGHYIACFSRSPDDLGQWRAYGDNGRGFAIGLAPELFHPEELTNQKPNERSWLAEVNYERDEAQRRLIDPITRVFDIAEMAKILRREDGEAFLTNCQTAISGAILWYAIQTKHPAYRHEQEVRLMIQNHLNSINTYIETRARSSSVVPFIRSPLVVKTPDKIVEIVIGPSAPDHAEDAIKTFLLSESLAKVPVRRSDIPYRAY